MASTDYDAPRTSTIELEAESLDLLKERRPAQADELGDDSGDEYELPGFDILDEELTAPVVPVRANEFRCGSCFLVLHHSLHAGTRKGSAVCRDCA